MSLTHNANGRTRLHFYRQRNALRPRCLLVLANFQVIYFHFYTNEY
jgi:hypothetical protein